MSITINIYYKGKNSSAMRFVREMIESGTVEAIRKEKGNLRYEYFLPLSNEETVLLIDSWTDQASLDRHHESPMMKKIASLREKYDLHMTVERFMSIDEVESDKKYIR